jgi:hypothetical protein
MLFLTRFVTFVILVPLLWIVFFIGTAAVIGGVAGAQAAQAKHATDIRSGYTAGQEAGRELGRQYGPIMLLGSLGLSVVASGAISFTGILPWCRRKPQPPPLPTF